VPAGARIQLLGAEDPEYAALVGNNVDRSAPGAPERLLVLKDGVVVADLGVRVVPTGRSRHARRCRSGWPWPTMPARR
jgi:hypothetical protein